MPTGFGPTDSDVSGDSDLMASISDNGDECGTGCTRLEDHSVVGLCESHIVDEECPKHCHVPM